MKLADDITPRLLTRAQPHSRFPLDFLTRVSCTPSPPLYPGLLRTSPTGRASNHTQNERREGRDSHRRVLWYVGNTHRRAAAEHGRHGAFILLQAWAGRPRSPLPRRAGPSRSSHGAPICWRRRRRSVWIPQRFFWSAATSRVKRTWSASSRRRSMRSVSLLRSASSSPCALSADAFAKNGRASGYALQRSHLIVSRRAYRAHLVHSRTQDGATRRCPSKSCPWTRSSRSST